MAAHPDRFYPIVDTAERVGRLARLGVRTVQLRRKDLAHDAAVRLVREALAAAAGTALAVIVNDYWRAAIEAGARHVHLGQEDLAGADPDAIRGAGLTLGISTHDGTELKTALRWRPDYVALGPIYPTTSKEVAFSAQGLARLAEWKRRIGALPLVAIGGITLERAPAVYAAGADSIAVLGDLSAADDLAARVRQWLAVAAA